jgi:hypothetical protein
MASRLKTYFRGEQSAPGERKLLFKLDAFILTFCCLMYFLNYLDRSNLSNAYVSGMKEELGFKGNQLNQINTVFTVGYTIGQVPCNIALYYIKPRYFFPGCMVSFLLDSENSYTDVHIVSMGWLNNGNCRRSKPRWYHGNQILPGHFRVVHFCGNSLYSWFMVYRKRARETIWHFHSVGTCRNHDRRLYPDWNQLKYGRSPRIVRLEVSADLNGPPAGVTANSRKVAVYNRWDHHNSCSHLWLLFLPGHTQKHQCALSFGRREGFSYLSRAGSLRANSHIFEVLETLL